MSAYVRQKHEKERARFERRQAKVGRKALRAAERMQAPDPEHVERPFPSRWPDAPELLDGVARTLSRGME